LGDDILCYKLFLLVRRVRGGPRGYNRRRKFFKRVEKIRTLKTPAPTCANRLIRKRIFWALQRDHGRRCTMG
jgi:hypothetical protein